MSLTSTQIIQQGLGIPATGHKQGRRHRARPEHHLPSAPPQQKKSPRHADFRRGGGYTL